MIAVVHCAKHSEVLGVGVVVIVQATLNTLFLLNAIQSKVSR